jgi:uncharacterized protein YndB with AHSA1/START domain
MTITEKTVASQTEALAFQIDLDHAPEKVWRALTDPALVSEWLLPVVEQKLDLEPGATFTFKTDPHPPWDGTVDCQLVEIEENRKLAYTWRVPFLDTVVTFTLAPTDSGTRLSIVQSGFKPDQKQNFGGARYGWKMMSGRLVELLGRIA